MLGVLVVDDDPLVVRATERVVRSFGCATFGATSAREAIALFHDHRDEIDAAVIDIALPELSGPEIAAQFVAERPGFTIVLMTGWPPDCDVLRRHLGDEKLEYLRKPYHVSDLRELLGIPVH